MRIYIPATLSMLRTLVKTGEFAPINGTAFALTPALRESYATGEAEELEYAAMADAGRASLRLLATELDTDPAAVPRRVVIAADVDDVTLRPDLDFAVVRLAGPVTLAEVAAAHVDNEAAERAVRTASAMIEAADLGDPDADFAVGDAEDHELAWYATQELPFLLDLM